MHFCRICKVSSLDASLFKVGQNICKKCDSARSVAYQKANKDATRTRITAWLAAHPEKAKEYSDRAAPIYAAKYPERVKAAKIKYRASEQGKAKEKATSAKYSLENKDKIAARRVVLSNVPKNKAAINARSARYQAAKKNAIPRWINKFFVNEAYDLAVIRSKLFGFEWNVDHIIPIKSKTVCGLHWEGNMQVIPRIINIKKGNRYDANGSTATSK